ncbi:MAG: sulfite exporter TauE/SafE family protein [Flavobacteriales bacterium]|nr:sulfite exporter TauE/SafE family protein [Flavobacteriales bacterium]
METLGYIGAILMGLSLGLIGGGGSILTVPILVYLFMVEPVLATAYSLFIVGLTSLVGSLSHMRMGNIHWRTAIVFGIPSILAVYATRAWLVPAIPDPIISAGGVVLSKAVGILFLFAAIMVAAAYSMIRKQKAPKGPDAPSETAVKFNYPLILAEGIVVGMVTGIVGAGGGFLIIPALVLLAKLPMKQAVGTSLIIIAAKSLIGFTGDLKGGEVIDWNFLLLFSAIAIVGIIAGSILSKRIPNDKLKPAFGWFVLAMGIYIIGKEVSKFT